MTETENIEEANGDGAMDSILYLIKNHIPRAVVPDLPRLISNIRGVKYFVDMNAFVEIEFEKKLHADAAKVEGFKFERNGQTETVMFVLAGGVGMYMSQNVDSKQFQGH